MTWPCVTALRFLAGRMLVLLAVVVAYGAVPAAASDDGKELPAKVSEHPIEIMARAFGLLKGSEE